MAQTMRERNRRRLLGPTAALAAVALIVAACGGDDDSTTPAATTAPPAPAATTAPEETMAPETTAATEETMAPETTAATEDTMPTGDPVKIAVLSDETGPSQTRSIKVLQATADAINAEGGLNGHPIELVATDLGSDATKAQAAVADLPDDIIAVFLGSSATEAAIADSLNALGVAVLGIGYAPQVWGGDFSIFGLTCSADNPGNCAQPNFLTTTPTIEQDIAMQLTGAIAAGATNVTSAYCVEVDSCAAAGPIFEGIGASLGLTVSPAVPISSTAPDYSAECIGFIQDGIDFVQVSASAAAAVNLVSSCDDQGYEGTFGASAGSVDVTILQAGGAFAGGLNGFPWFVDDPLVNEYRDIVQGAGVPEADWAYSAGTAMYSNMRLLQKAIADYADPSAPLDAAAVLAAMFQVDGEDLGGLLANPVSFSPDNLDRTLPCYWTYLKDADGNVTNPNGGLNTECYPAG